MNDNSSTANITINITKTDNQGPTISSFTVDDTIINLTTEGTSTALLVIFTAVVTDNVSLSSVNLPNTNSTGSSGNTYTYTKLFDGDNYPFGNTLETYTFSATDTNGNTSTSSVTLTIIKMIILVLL